MVTMPSVFNTCLKLQLPSSRSSRWMNELLRVGISLAWVWAG